MKPKLRVYSFGLLLSFCLASLAGCLPQPPRFSVKTAVAPLGSADAAGKVAVPFLIIEKYKAGTGRQIWESSALTDRFATGLVRSGYTVIDRSYIRKVLADNRMTPSDLFDESNIERIGTLLKADTIVLGKLTIIELEDGRILDKILNARGIRVSTGIVVFSVSALDTSRFRMSRAEELVDEAIAAMTGIPLDVGDAKAGETGGAEETSGDESQAAVSELEGEAAVTPDVGVGSELGIETSAPAEDATQ